MLRMKKQLIVREGVVSGLQRTTHVSGGGDTAARTIHLCLFSLGNDRIKLALREPASIADGDLIRVSGYQVPGQVNAIACRNLTTGWISSAKTPGCGCLIGAALMFLALDLIISGILYGATQSVFVASGPFIILVPIAIVGIMLLRTSRLTAAAHALISQ